MEADTDGILELHRSAVRGLGRLAGRLVKCMAGAVWVTQEGDPRDHVLLAGDTLRIDQPGRVAVQALRTSRIRISSARPDRRSPAA